METHFQHPVTIFDELLSPFSTRYQKSLETWFFQGLQPSQIELDVFFMKFRVGCVHTVLKLWQQPKIGRHRHVFGVGVHEPQMAQFLLNPVVLWAFWNLAFHWEFFVYKASSLLLRCWWMLLRFSRSSFNRFFSSAGQHSQNFATLAFLHWACC